ncbi:MAG: hypothetical protein KAQ98_05910 [Bacteriovoracaceae bacterium]|nr:hypothetical protein [Bacteriovoracaceae bacterium]
MKSLTVLIILMVMVACDSSNSPKNRTSKPKIKKVEKTFLPPSPKQVALDFLNAYKNKDLLKIKSLSMPVLAMNFSEKNFKEDVLKTLSTWDGSIRDIRYTYWMGEMLMAVIQYTNKDSDTMQVLSLTYLGKKWVFGMEGLKKIKSEAYNILFKKFHSESEIKHAIVGNWKCIRYSMMEKEENSNFLAQTEMTFNDDETVTQKNNGIISKGKYSIDKNIIKLTNLKREDGKRSFGKRTLVFNDKTTIVISNTAVKAVFKKQVLSQ